MKSKKLKKILNNLRNNPSVMATSDVYAAARDYGFDDGEAKGFVHMVFGDVKTQMLLSSVFRAGYSRALIAVEQEAEYQAGKETLSERKRRAKELMDLLPDGEVKEKMEDEVFWGLELLEDAGI